MSNCDPSHATSYESIKKFLLQELHLSPSVYLDKFNALVRDKDETFGQFFTRLTSLLNIMSRVGKWTTVMINWLI